MKSENKVSRHLHGNFSCIGSSEAGQSNMSPMVGLQVVDIMISINISFMKIFNIIITMIVVSIKISMFMKILNIMMITMKYKGYEIF